MKYSRDTIIEKNITLSFEFERYLLEHPEAMDEIPSGAEVVLLPKDDPELYRINLEAAQAARREADHPEIVYVEVEGLAPPRSRLINPHIGARPMAQR